MAYNTFMKLVIIPYFLFPWNVLNKISFSGGAYETAEYCSNYVRPDARGLYGSCRTPGCSDAVSGFPGRRGHLFPQCLRFLSKLHPFQSRPVYRNEPGAPRPGGYQDGIDWDYPHMLPQVLSRHGYHTEAVGKLHVHPPLRRCGFHNLTLHDGYIGFYRRPSLPTRQNQLYGDSYLKWLKDRYGNAADVNDTGLECNSFMLRPGYMTACPIPPTGRLQKVSVSWKSGILTCPFSS